MNINPENPIHWDDSQYYLPLPQHRRRMILNILKPLNFSDCLDAGCAQHYLLATLTKRFPIKGYGCDLSEQIIAVNKQRLPQCDFTVLDLEHAAWPQQKQFDLVICSEVLEHIVDWKNAVKNLAAMSKHYLLITVPSGKLKKTDILVGHHRLFQGKELIAEIEQHGFRCRKVIRHGFPVHSLYKFLINLMNTDKLYNSFHSGKKYSLFKKIFARVLSGLFFMNYLFSGGNQLFILAELT